MIRKYLAVKFEGLLYKYDKKSKELFREGHQLHISRLHKDVSSTHVVYRIKEIQDELKRMNFKISMIKFFTKLLLVRAKYKNE